MTVLTHTQFKWNTLQKNYYVLVDFRRKKSVLHCKSVSKYGLQFLLWWKHLSIFCEGENIPDQVFQLTWIILCQISGKLETEPSYCFRRRICQRKRQMLCLFSYGWNLHNQLLSLECFTAPVEIRRQWNYKHKPVIMQEDEVCVEYSTMQFTGTKDHTPSLNFAPSGLAGI